MFYDHQQKIIDEDPHWSGGWLGTGSGKTRLFLALARGRTLVICPKTQRDDQNWEREAEKMKLDIDLTVVSKEDFRKLAKNGETGQYDTVIVDEAHTVLGVTPATRWKNRVEIPKASQLFDYLKEYIKKFPPKRLYLATATIAKSPMTVWGAGVILNKWKEDTFFKFRDKFYTKLPMPGRQVYVPRTGKQDKEQLARLVNLIGYTGRLTDYFDVPEQTFKDEWVDLTAPQTARIKDMKLEYPDPLVQIGKRHQIENGVLTDDDEHIKDNKTERLLEYAEEFPQMIVFAKYTAQIEKYYKAFKKAGKKVFVMSGQTKDRGQVLEQLKDMDEYVFIVQAQVSAGWELPDCPVMIFASRTYSFVDYEQAKGRILRANKLKKNLYINLMVKGGIDEAVHKSLLNKEDFNEKIYVEKDTQTL